MELSYRHLAAVESNGALDEKVDGKLELLEE